ncbi:uncharacterized protein N0V89_001543 [Didymosphaeria variabile]|uniref:Uncharacterized protein n=1 Tax=Didymosphaeria variabile TaxID=1932322 RepID=A0A9W8XZK4_9PLEO|nr:uncharacterized protein N0V89_001543 [Didymosphaeria variabile]KAJ4360974.1 hypothetical protein N0V89_001543 [Didymosphaeria variabile]
MESPFMETAFQKFNIGPSGPKGREYKDMWKKKEMDPAMFSARVLPENIENTRVLAVCGIPPEDSHPVEDGWFFSDFFAFKHVLSGVGKAQTWMACLSPENLVQEHNVFLHGNPYHDRKVVLNKDMVRKGFGADIVVIPRLDIRDAFAKKLQQEAHEAKQNKQPLVVLVFAHGREEGGGWWLGPPGLNLFSRARFQGLVDQEIQVSIMSTACYGGQWVIDTTLNRTYLAAAGPIQESESWNGSKSCNRKCGSIYASALLKAWREEADEAQGLLQKSAGSVTETESTYHNFTGAVWDSLFSLDRFASDHDIRFSVQDEDWAAGWSARFGLPASAIRFEEKWESLPTVQKDVSLGYSFLNRDPALSVDLNNLDVLSSKLNVRHGGSLNSARNQVCAMGALYLQSLPGEDSLSSNTSLHGKLGRTMDKRKEVDWSLLNTVLQGVNFRMELSHLATELVQTAGMKLPRGLTCHETDILVLGRQFEKENRKKWGCIVQQVMGVLPEPSEELNQGVDWPKPRRYIAAAIFLSEGVQSLDDVQSAVAAVNGLLSEELRCSKKTLEGVPEVRGRKKDWYQAMKKRLRSLSPDKKQKRISLSSTTPRQGPNFPPSKQ